MGQRSGGGGRGSEELITGEAGSHRSDHMLVILVVGPMRVGIQDCLLGKF